MRIVPFQHKKGAVPMMKMIKRKVPGGNRDGIALAVVVIITAVVSILAFTTLAVASSDIHQTVNVQNYYADYALARSAVDVAAQHFRTRMDDFYSSDLSTYLAALTVFEGIDEPGPVDINNLTNAKDDLMFCYNQLVDDILPPNSTQTRELSLTQGTTPYTVVVSRSAADDIEVTCTYGKATARQRLGKVSEDMLDAYIESGDAFSGSVIYSWGKIHIGSGPGNTFHITVNGVTYDIATASDEEIEFLLEHLGFGDFAHVGTYNSSGDADAEPIYNEVKIIKPEDITGYDPTVRSGSLPTSVPITQAHSGVYNNIQLSKDTTYTVDLTGGNVVLVCSSFTLENGSDIRINVKNDSSNIYNFYIVVVENYNPATGTSGINRKVSSNNFINLNNNKLEIVSIYSPLDLTRDMPMTYFIAYNDTCQYYNSIGENPVPPFDGNLGSSSPLNPALMGTTYINYYDDVIPKHGGGTRMDVHWYMPFCNLIFDQNNFILRGTIHAGNVDLKNNNSFEYIPMNDSNFGGGESYITETFPIDTIPIFEQTWIK